MAQVAVQPAHVLVRADPIKRGGERVHDALHQGVGGKSAVIYLEPHRILFLRSFHCNLPFVDAPNPRTLLPFFISVFK